jgi:hypothetical protein
MRALPFGARNLADAVRISRARMVWAGAVLIEARTYKRDADGRFGSGGGGEGGTVLASKTIHGRYQDDEMDLSVVRNADGATELHLGVRFDGDHEGVSVTLNQTAARQLSSELTAGVAAGKVLQREANGVQKKADDIDARISELDQKTVGEPTGANTREYKPLSPADEARRADLVREWDSVDERIANLEDDGEVAASGVVRGGAGDVHYSVDIKTPAKWSSVRVGVAETGAQSADDALQFTLNGAEKLADHLSGMADLM